MTPEHVELPEDLIVVGTAIRTSPETAAADIPALWQRFMQDDLANQVPQRSDDPATYAVYCDYQSDYRGPYTLLLGVAVKHGAPVPDQMRRTRIPSGHYASFHVEGDPAQVIWQTWQHINERWDARNQRRYVADFERYAPEALPGGAVKADVVVGLVRDAHADLGV
jgi:predicted transcriptional regulator YdeE